MSFEHDPKDTYIRADEKFERSLQHMLTKLLDVLND